MALGNEGPGAGVEVVGGGDGEMGIDVLNAVEKPLEMPLVTGTRLGKAIIR